MGASPCDAVTDDLAETGLNRTPNPRTPRRIALICTDPCGAESSTQFLLDDFHDALIAYDDASSIEGADEPPEMLRLRCTAAGTLEGEGSDGLSLCDAVVIGYSASSDALRIGPAALPIAPGSRVYAICNLGCYEPEQAEASFAELECWCRSLDTQWCGGLAIGGGDMVPALKKSPRLGALRRNWSEGMDRLIAAVRMGMTIAAATRQFGGSPAELEAAEHGAIFTCCAIPRFAYIAAVEISRRKGCR